ncbi:glycosyltransferase [Nitratifractor sp.]
MKILLFNYALTGGVGKYIVTLAKGLLQQGAEVHIVLYEEKRDFEPPRDAILHQLDVLSNKSALIAKSLQRLLQELEPIDMILSNSSPSNKILSRLNHPKAWHVVHSAETKEHSGPLSGVKQAWRKEKYRKLYHQKKLIVVSKDLERHITQTLGAIPERVEYIPNPFDFEEIRELAGENLPEIPKEPYIINVSRFDIVQKRQDLLLQAYQLADIPHKLVLIGGGKDRRKIESFIEELGLQDRVILHDFTPNPYAWMKHADLYVSSSDFEGFGRSIAEALIVGTPVVSTDCPSGPREILTQQLSRFLVPPGNPTILNTTIKYALTSYPIIYNNYINKFCLKEVSMDMAKLVDTERGK